VVARQPLGLDGSRLHHFTDGTIRLVGVQAVAEAARQREVLDIRERPGDAVLVAGQADGAQARRVDDDAMAR
jgi:hypothetical protein